MNTDLDELLLKVNDEESRAYLQESVRCYNAGAYRASVVLSVAAGMDGLRRRLKDLASSGGAIAPIVDAHRQIDALFKSQKSYEDQLINLCENSASMLEPPEATKLRLTLKLRHLCAHPSGHVGLPEDAVFAIATVVELVLSRPALVGMSAVDSIIDRLPGPNFFPEVNDQRSNRATVEAEIRSIHPFQFNALASKLVKRISELAMKVKAGSGQDIQLIRVNYRTFLAHFCTLSPQSQQAAWRYADALVEADVTKQDALFILSFDPIGCHLAGTLVRDRAISLIRRNLADCFARRAARTLREKSLLTEEETKKIEIRGSRVFLESNQIDTETVRCVTELGWPEIETTLFDGVIQRCGSSTFNIANTAIQLIQELTVEQALRVAAALQVKYILTVAENAGRHWSASEAVFISERGLGGRSAFLDSVLQAVRLDDALIDANTDWEYIVRICEASNRSDVVLGLLEAFEDAGGKNMTIHKAICHLMSSSDLGISSRSQVLLAKMDPASTDE